MKQTNSAGRPGVRKDGGRCLEPKAGILVPMDWLCVLCGGGHGNLHA